MNKLARFKRLQPVGEPTPPAPAPAPSPAAKTRKKPVSAPAEAPQPAKERPLHFIGLDVSLRSTGFVVLNAQGALVEQGLIKNKEGAVSKLADYNGVVTPIKTLVQRYWSTGTVLIAREDYAYAAGSSSDTPLKELGGILDWVISAIPGILYHGLVWVPIARIKKWACGKGNAEKADVMKGMYEQFRFDGNNDEADAFACATLIAEAHKGIFPNLKPYQKEASTDQRKSLAELA